MNQKYMMSETMIPKNTQPKTKKVVASLQAKLIELATLLGQPSDKAFVFNKRVSIEDPKYVAAVLAARRDGKSFREIAAQVGGSTFTARKLLTNLGLPTQTSFEESQNG